MRLHALTQMQIVECSKHLWCTTFAQCCATPGQPADQSMAKGQITQFACYCYSSQIDANAARGVCALESLSCHSNASFTLKSV